MFQINDKIVYKREVCVIKSIKKFNNIDYYVLVPVNDESLIIDVPINNNLIRKIISKKEAENIIANIHNIDYIICDNDKLLEYEYKKLLSDGSHESLIKIIKTTYKRNKERVDSKRKIGEKDDQFFKKAERLLFTELSFSLNMNYDDTKNYVVSCVENNIKVNR